MIADWLIIVIALTALWVMLRMFNLVGDLIEYAARWWGEDLSANKERERS